MSKSEILTAMIGGGLMVCFFLVYSWPSGFPKSRTALFLGGLAGLVAVLALFIALLGIDELVRH